MFFFHYCEQLSFSKHAVNIVYSLLANHAQTTQLSTSQKRFLRNVNKIILIIQVLIKAYLLVFDVIKTPFGDVSCVRVMSKALIGFIFKFLGSSKHSSKLHNAIESPSHPRTFTGHSLERAGPVDYVLATMCETRRLCGVRRCSSKMTVQALCMCREGSP